MSLKKDIQNMFHNMVHAISGASIDFFEALAHAIEENGGDVLRLAAAAAVAAAEATGGSGNDKFKAAKEAVIAELTLKGLPIVINAVHGAIEAAVAKLKAPV